MSLKSTSFPKELFVSRAKQIKKKSKTLFCRRKTAEDSNAKIKVSPNIPCTVLLFKASAFLQIFFPKNLFFRQVLKKSVFPNSKCLTFIYLFWHWPIYHFIDEHPLKTSNKRTHILLLIKQFDLPLASEEVGCVSSR